MFAGKTENDMQKGRTKRKEKKQVLLPTPQQLDKGFSPAVPPTVSEVRFVMLADDRPDLVNLALQNINEGLTASSESIRYKYTKLVIDKTYQTQEKVDASVEHKILIKDITDL